jgi:hypothetical protein
MDPHKFGNMVPHPDPHQNDKLDQEQEPDMHQFSDDKPKCMEYEPILAVLLWV